MVIKVGINGFGRIGRIMFRTCVQNPNVEVTAINDPAIDVEYICYLIKFDSTHGNFNGDIMPFNGDIKINGNLIKIFREKLPSAVQWYLAGVQYVIESSGMFTSYEKAVGHFAAEGVRRVVVTAPSADVPMFIMGVNNNDLKPDQKVISSASSTLYCLAAIIKVLENDFGVTEGFVTSIHAMTPSLKPLDGLCLRGKHWRDYRSIHQNIIPATTGACKALGKVLPQLKDKLVGLAFRVPIVNVSVLDLTVRLNKDTSLLKIVESVEIASKTYLKGVLNISNEETVSSDFMRDTHSCILDIKSSIQHKPNFYKFICWYENEFSYACRVIDTILFSEKQWNRAQTTLMKNKSLIVKRKHIIQHINQHSTESLRHFITLGDCGTKVLPDVLRNVSKAFEFKVNSVSPCLPFRRKFPAKVSVMNQTSLPYVTKTKSDIFKIIDYDPVKPETRCLDKSKDTDSCMTLKLMSDKAVRKSQVQDRMVKTQEEVHKMMKAARELLKKSNVGYMNKDNKKELSMEVAKVKDGAVCGDKVKKDDVDKTQVKHDLDNAKAKEDAMQKTKLKECATENVKAKEDIMKNVKGEEGDAPDPKLKDDTLQNSKSKDESSGPVQDKNVKESDNQAKTMVDKATTESMSESSSEVIDPLKQVNTLLKYIESELESDTATDSSDSCEVQVCDEISDDDNVNTVAATKNVEGVGGDLELSNEDDYSNDDDEEEDEDGRVILKRLLAQKPYSVDPIESDSDPSIEISDVDLDSKNGDRNQCTNKGSVKVGNITNRRGYIDIAQQFKNNTTEYTNKYVITGKMQEGKKEQSKSKIFRHDYQPTIDKQSMSLKKKQSSESIKLEFRQDKQNTAITANINNIEQDIYDKLDSASPTNSENSFDVNEKKSQVIRFNDLTDSLEDLGRLEKICKIIEISDELSDVLFAKLKVNDNKEMKNKKWSFKDLCEKLNLDDFCNKVFRESNI